jgi:hypothetical protein
MRAENVPSSQRVTPRVAADPLGRIVVPLLKSGGIRHEAGEIAGRRQGATVGGSPLYDAEKATRAALSLTEWQAEALAN